MPLSHLRSLGPGPVTGTGRRSAYRQVSALAGEPHRARSELGGHELEAGSGAHAPIECLLHVTDMHVADVQSPARFEFLNREFGDPRFQALVPVQRPQEALTPHVVQALVRTINHGMRGPATGLRPRLVATGGDSVDNAQWNELQAFTRLLGGGLVDLTAGVAYEGVQSPDWPDDLFWVPDGGGATPDLFRREFGYPLHPGLMERALQPFDAEGLRLPWLGCRGNHEALCQGVGVVTPALEDGMTGGRKPTALPEGFDPDEALNLFIAEPEFYLGGAGRDVTADRRRRPIRGPDLTLAPLRGQPVLPGGSLALCPGTDGDAWYVHDTPSVRFIVLDTACAGGSAAGCVDERQLSWLEDRLREAHSVHRTAEGGPAGTDAPDRLVVILSHHGSKVIDSDRRHRDGTRNVGGRRVLELLHRFDNVVLWLNGHTHTHAIRARPDPSGAGPGLWEVTTASVIDWPCQARLIELFDAGRGILGIASTMVDHDSPLTSGDATSSLEMAALHRELAANAPWAGFDSPLPGTPLDRNVVMARPVGLALERLTLGG